MTGLLLLVDMCLCEKLKKKYSITFLVVDANAPIVKGRWAVILALLCSWLDAFVQSKDCIVLSGGPADEMVGNKKSLQTVMKETKLVN